MNLINRVTVIGKVAKFTYQGNPTRVLLDEMDEDAQFTAMLILAECRGIEINDIIKE